jgi:hypothetical protein
MPCGVGVTPRGWSGGTILTGTLSVFKRGSCRVWASSIHDWTPSYLPRLTPFESPKLGQCLEGLLVELGCRTGGAFRGVGVVVPAKLASSEEGAACALLVDTTGAVTVVARA